MMNVKSVLLSVFFFQFLEYSKTFIVDVEFDRAQCDSLCVASGGTADFDEGTKLCKCTSIKNIDGTDVELINKNAKLLGKQLGIVNLSKFPSVIIKREVVNETDTHEESPTENSLMENQDVTTPNVIITTEVVTTVLPKNEFEEIVGQQAPNPQRKLHQRLVGQRKHRESRPITPEQQRLIVQQMKDHLNRLSQTFDQRSRQMEIDAMRANLRQLSQTVLIQHPQQRSRLRNIVEETKKRQHRQRLTPHTRIVGAAAPRNSESSNLPSDLKHNQEVNETVSQIFKKTHPHFEIITQDPSLIDE